MALSNISIPSGCYLQPNISDGFDSEGKRTFSYSIKGVHSSLSNLKNTLYPGKVVDANIELVSCDLVGAPAGLGVLTLNCATRGSYTVENEVAANNAELLKDIWSVKSVRNDVSIIAYCGNGDYDAVRADVEAWMKEPDANLAAVYRYRRSDNVEMEIPEGSASRDIIDKLKSGIEQVMRFYPVVTRKRTYDDAPDGAFQDLGTINTPVLPARIAATTDDANSKHPKVRYPTGISAVIAAHQWLKVEDSADENPDGSWTRVESWWGILLSDMNANTGWDPNLYSAVAGTRWRMPHSGSNSSAAVPVKQKEDEEDK